MKTHATEKTLRVIRSTGLISFEYKCDHARYRGYTNREIISLLDGKLAVLVYCCDCHSHIVCVITPGQRMKTRYDDNYDVSQITSLRAGVIAYKTRRSVVIWDYNQDRVEVVEAIGRREEFTPLTLLAVNGQLFCWYSNPYSAGCDLFNFTTNAHYPWDGSHITQAVSLSDGSLAFSRYGDNRIFIGNLTTNTFRVWNFAWMNASRTLEITALVDNLVALNDDEFIYVVNASTAELRYRVRNNPAFRDMTALANGKIAFITNEYKNEHSPPIFLGQIIKPCVLEAKRAINMMAQSNRGSKNSVFKKLPVDMCLRVATMLASSEYHEYLTEYADKSFDFKRTPEPRTFLGLITSYFFSTVRRNSPWVPDAAPIKESLKHSR